MSVTTKRRNSKLTQWQIAALERLIDNEMGRRADEGNTPWVCGLQSLRGVMSDAHEVTVTKLRTIVKGEKP